MDTGGSSLIGCGIYSVSEASRLSGVSPRRIRRWLRGYRYRSGTKRYTSPPVWQGDLPPIDSELALSFLDLVEVKFVEAFLQMGVSWVVLRRARQRARKLFKDSHPFCSSRFVTDGHAIFVELYEATGEPSLVDIAKDQRVFGQIVKPFLKELEFSSDNVLVRWRPMGTGHQVVLDPKRSFGQPIVDCEGVPTRVLSQAMKSSKSITEVVRWFEVKESAVRDAMEFEQKMAA